MSREGIKGRLFLFLFLAIFFLIGGPVLAKEGALSAPTAVLKAKHYVYSGEVQYVTLDRLYHPLESEGYYSFSWYKDGELLPCASSSLPIFSVSDSGLYNCKVTFTYNGETSSVSTETVEIQMRKKIVEIPEISPLIYTGYRQFPPVYETADYRIEENAGAIEAGEYSLSLSLKDGENTAFPDVAGGVLSEGGKRLSLPYSVMKAENRFSTPLSVPPCYEGNAPLPQAFARFGEVRYLYFSDSLGQSCIERPTACGIYYVQAVVDESKSVLPLFSPLIRFEILPMTVSALRMLSPPERLSYTAFESLDLRGLSLIATMADGSLLPVPMEAISVQYPIGKSCLFAKDTYVLLSYGGALLPLSVSVRRVVLDFSSVEWSASGWVYDGAEREITLQGLPPEAVVSEYRDNRVTNAGTHTAFAILSFDRENYEGPSSLSHTVSVQRQILPLPTLSPVVYSGALISVPPPTSPLYVCENLPSVLHAGSYPITLRLLDPTNYTFEGQSGDVATVFFEVLPMELRVVIEDVTLWLGDRFSLPGYRVIAGNPIATDDLGFGARENEGGIEYFFENPDYKVTSVGGTVTRTYRLPPAAEAALFLGFSALVLFVLSIFGMVILYRKRVHPLKVAEGHSAEPTCTYPLFTENSRPPLSSPASEYTLSEAPMPPQAESFPDLPAEISPEGAELEPDAQSGESAEEDEKRSTCVDAVDVSTADALITDALAEALVMAEERVIYTEGRRHGVINVDTLSAAFSPGEEVDINRLKKKKLIAPDVGYLKVLARGSINKPLTVYADDFSLGAIKMIALTGGRTFHVKTRPKG